MAITLHRLQLMIGQIRPTLIKNMLHLLLKCLDQSYISKVWISLYPQVHCTYTITIKGHSILFYSILFLFATMLYCCTLKSQQNILLRNFLDILSHSSFLYCVSDYSLFLPLGCSPEVTFLMTTCGKQNRF